MSTKKHWIFCRKCWQLTNQIRRSFILQGQCYEALGEMKMARYCYRKAVHENPSLSEAYFRIGETYEHEGLWEQA